MEDLYRFEEEYRDTLATVDAEGKRIWIYPKKPKGKYHRARIFVTVALLSLLFAGPFIRIGGHPLLLFNILERKFVIFGIPFWPQDFHIFGLAMITFFVFIILFTVVFGRLWCGWACPQTLFMEMVFRKIEYWIEGDANQQRKLDQAPWNREKILKKGFKQLIFLLIAVLIAHTLMAYLVGIDRVKELVTQPPYENGAGFVGLVFFTGVFYGVFARLREQACVAICPYGRLQGVLLNKDSILVAYDWLRGEPRGKLKKDQAMEEQGDCIDCKLCVHACPTGIDIRNGTQLECVNCTACIDACDDVMTKIHKPEGLIRYASHKSIKEGKKELFTPRVVGYSGVLAVLIALLTFVITTRSEVEATITRVRGTLYQETADQQISNLYNVQIVNKTFDPIELQLELKDYPLGSMAKVGGGSWKMEANGLSEGVIFIKIPKEQITEAKTQLKIQIMNEAGIVDEVSISFLGPIIPKP